MTEAGVSTPSSFVSALWFHGSAFKQLTQVIHAPLSLPKAISQAGSSDWKYSSGWKNVLMLRAFRIRNATRNSRISCDVAALWVRSNARRDKVFSSSVLAEESLPILVEASEVGVDDIGAESYSKLHALLPCGTRTGSERLARRSFPQGCEPRWEQGCDGSERETPLFDP